jgi:hypothetical protein
LPRPLCQKQALSAAFRRQAGVNPVSWPEDPRSTRRSLQTLAAVQGQTIGTDDVSRPQYVQKCVPKAFDFRAGLESLARSGSPDKVDGRLSNLRWQRKWLYPAPSVLPAVHQLQLGQ